MRHIYRSLPFPHQGAGTVEAEVAGAPGVGEHIHVAVGHEGVADDVGDFRLELGEVLNLDVVHSALSGLLPGTGGRENLPKAGLELLEKRHAGLHWTFYHKVEMIAHHGKGKEPAASDENCNSNHAEGQVHLFLAAEEDIRLGPFGTYVVERSTALEMHLAG